LLLGTHVEDARGPEALQLLIMPGSYIYDAVAGFGTLPYNRHIMDKRRVLFWAVFIIILALIVWGLVAAMGKPAGPGLSTAPAVTAADHVIGPANAPVTLIEYGDFQCPACGYYYPLVERLFNESSSTMRLVFRHFPIANLHPNAIPAALAAEAASQQGKFWQMYRELYSDQSDWVDAQDPTSRFEGYATSIGLNLARFRADSASSTLRDFITAQHDDGINIGVSGTPSFFINGKAISNPQSYDEFKALIQAAASTTTQ
jgi:protein-disulfide isomerase